MQDRAVSLNAVKNLISYDTKHLIPYEYEKNGAKVRGWDTARFINVTKLEQLPSVTPCEDAISRQVVKEQMIKYGFRAPDMTVTEFVEDLPFVKPQELKTGHWIYSRCDMYECSKCGMTYTDLSCGDNMADYCPYCGSYNGSDDNENCD